MLSFHLTMTWEDGTHGKVITNFDGGIEGL